MSYSINHINYGMKNGKYCCIQAQLSFKMLVILEYEIYKIYVDIKSDKKNVTYRMYCEPWPIVFIYIS